MPRRPAHWLYLTGVALIVSGVASCGGNVASTGSDDGGSAEGASSGASSSPGGSSGISSDASGGSSSGNASTGSSSGGPSAGGSPGSALPTTLPCSQFGGGSAGAGPGVGSGTGGGGGSSGGINARPCSARPAVASVSTSVAHALKGPAHASGPRPPSSRSPAAPFARGLIRSPARSRFAVFRAERRADRLDRASHRWEDTDSGWLCGFHPVTRARRVARFDGMAPAGIPALIDAISHLEGVEATHVETAPRHRRSDPGRVRSPRTSRIIRPAARVSSSNSRRLSGANRAPRALRRRSGRS